MPPIPVDITDTASVRNYLYEHFKGKEVEIKSDGRLVLFTSGGLKDTLKRRREHRNSFSALDAIVEKSYPVGYETVDDRHKLNRPDLQGQFIYAALLDLGQTEKYIATIKLDDTVVDKRALFKDISIKKDLCTQDKHRTQLLRMLPYQPILILQYSNLLILSKAILPILHFFKKKSPLRYLIKKLSFRWRIRILLMMMIGI